MNRRSTPSPRFRPRRPSRPAAAPQERDPAPEPANESEASTATAERAPAPAPNATTPQRVEVLIEQAIDHHIGAALSKRTLAETLSDPTPASDEDVAPCEAEPIIALVDEEQTVKPDPTPPSAQPAAPPSARAVRRKIATARRKGRLDRRFYRRLGLAALAANGLLMGAVVILLFSALNREPASTQASPFPEPPAEPLMRDLPLEEGPALFRMDDQPPASDIAAHDVPPLASDAQQPPVDPFAQAGIDLSLTTQVHVDTPGANATDPTPQAKTLTIGEAPAALEPSASAAGSASAFGNRAEAEGATPASEAATSGPAATEAEPANQPPNYRRVRSGLLEVAAALVELNASISKSPGAPPLRGADGEPVPEPQAPATQP